MPRPHHWRVQVKHAVHVGAGYIPPAAHKRAGRPSADRRSDPSNKLESPYRQASRDPFRGAAVFDAALNISVKPAKRKWVQGEVLRSPKHKNPPSATHEMGRRERVEGLSPSRVQGRALPSPY